MKASDWTFFDCREEEYKGEIVNGDVFFLTGSSEHMLFCGDAKQVLESKNLLVDTAFTSPPYKMSHNLSWKNKNSEIKSKYLLPEKITDYTKFLTDYTETALKYSDFAMMNLQSLSNNKVNLIEYLYNLRDRYVDVLIWDKGYTAFPVVPNVFRSDFEYLYIFSKDLYPKRTIRCAPHFHGTLSNVQHIRRKTRNPYSGVHNATFAKEFSDFVVENLCGNSVIDMFAGTGTSLMSCEKFGRYWYGIEIMPEYCRIILNRWIQNGGKVEKGGTEEHGSD